MEKEISKLTDDCLNYFHSNCYTQNRIDKYKSMWKNGILSWMQKKGLTLYSADVGEEFIHSLITGGYVTAGKRDIIRSVHVLTDFMNMGYIRKKTFTPVEHPLYGEIGQQMQKIVNHLRALRRSQITINDYKLYLNRFLTFLAHEHIFTVSTIRERHILKFLSTTENNKVNIASCLRVLFLFWHEQKVTTEDYSELLNHYKWVKPEKVPSYYSATEVSIVEKSVDRSSGVGKRDYAMLLLASRLGLRASNIANLKFNNIDWEKNEIHLSQYKTGNSVMLPFGCRKQGRFLCLLKFNARILGYFSYLLQIISGCRCNNMSKYLLMHLFTYLLMMSFVSMCCRS